MNCTVVRLRLFVAGDGQNSVAARANLNALCAAHLQGRHEVEVVDVFLQPTRALADGIFMTPTLLKLSPGPACKIVGTLSDPLPVLQALGLQAAVA